MTQVMSPVREQKKEQTRERLIACAIELFEKRGIEGTTVDEIATRAGTGKGTVYNYFASKEDIIVAFMAQMESRMQPAIRRYAESDKPLGQVLASFAWHHLRPKSPYRSFVRAFLARMMSPDEGFLPHVVEMQTAIDANLTGLFERLQKRGRVSEKLAMADLLLNFKTMQLGISMLWALEGPPWTGTRKVVKTQMAMFARGIEA